MFRDSEISKQFACGKDKNAYLASFGLAPYFSDQLCKTLNECPIYSVSFDEAFNRITKTEQMDLAIRYWDPKLKCTSTRYIGSEFLGHSTANNLLKAFNKATAHLDQEKIINLGMDGPTTNHIQTVAPCGYGIACSKKQRQIFAIIIYNDYNATAASENSRKPIWSLFCTHFRFGLCKKTVFDAEKKSGQTQNRVRKSQEFGI